MRQTDRVPDRSMASQGYQALEKKATKKITSIGQTDSLANQKLKTETIENGQKRERGNEKHRKIVT